MGGNGQGFQLFGEDHRRTGRKKRGKDRPFLRQKAAHLFGQNAGFLGIDLKPLGLQTFGTKPPHDIAPSLESVQMQQGRRLWMTQDTVDQRIRLAPRRLGLKAQIPRDLCRAVAHAKGNARQETAPFDHAPGSDRPGL